MTDTKSCQSQSPDPIQNRPGLASIAYRIADHSGFTGAMRLELRAKPPLRELNASTDDPTNALIDAWAVTLDVLSFYQERIANEHYLGTAVERGSVLELARQIGYELRPGVAASTFLAFTVEENSVTGAPNIAEVSEGTQAQSIPGQDELPQIFETVEAIHAEAAWNDLRARTSEPYTVQKNDSIIYLKGVTTNLGLGDGLLLIGEEREVNPGSERWDFRRVRSLTADSTLNLTTIVLDRPLGSESPFKKPAARPRVYAMRSKAQHFGANAPDWNSIHEDIQGNYETTIPGSLGRPIATAIIGSGSTGPEEWPGLNLSAITGDSNGTTLLLDRLYKEIVPLSWVVVASPTYAEVYLVTEVAEDAVVGFAISSKSTRLTIDGENLIREFNSQVRQIVIHGESEELEQSERPITTDVSGNTILLQEPVEGLEAGQMLVISGTSTAGDEVAEVIELNRTDAVSDTTQLTFETVLEHTYVRDTVRINANVARATHGESRSETLGSGDGAVSFQAFALSNRPLTHVSAANPSGHESTLVLRVDGIEWSEQSTLYAQEAEATVYQARIDDDATSTVEFGDGITGARLPTGNENVTAEYRVGSGLDGHVDARQIKLLTKKPLGVKSVENPLAPSGGDDSETLSDARENAPLTVLTLDRVVSLRDVESFARAFTGIGKAQVARPWSGETRFVYVTVAGVDGDAVLTTSTTYINLRDALLGAWHGAEKIRIESYESIKFSLAASLILDESYVAEDVLAAARGALVLAFSFDNRSLGQGVTGGEVMAVLQEVDGVIAVDLDTLNGKDALEHPRILARPARYVYGLLEPAQLVTIDADDPDAIALEAPAS